MFDTSRLRQASFNLTLGAIALAPVIGRHVARPSAETKNIQIEAVPGTRDHSGVSDIDHTARSGSALNAIKFTPAGDGYSQLERTGSLAQIQSATQARVSAPTFFPCL